MHESDPARRRRAALVFFAALWFLSGCTGGSTDVLAGIKKRGELRWGADAQAGADTKLYDSGLEAVYGDLLIPGRLDAVLIDEPTALYYGKIDGVTILEKSFGEVKYAVACPKGQDALRAEVDATIESLRKDG